MMSKKIGFVALSLVAASTLMADDLFNAGFTTTRLAGMGLYSSATPDASDMLFNPANIVALGNNVIVDSAGAAIATLASPVGNLGLVVGRTYNGDLLTNQTALKTAYTTSQASANAALAGSVGLDFDTLSDAKNKFDAIYGTKLGDMAVGARLSYGSYGKSSGTAVTNSNSITNDKSNAGTAPTYQAASSSDTYSPLKSNSASDLTVEAGVTMGALQAVASVGLIGVDSAYKKNTETSAFGVKTGNTGVNMTATELEQKTTFSEISTLKGNGMLAANLNVAYALAGGLGAYADFGFANKSMNLTQDLSNTVAQYKATGTYAADSTTVNTLSYTGSIANAQTDFDVGINYNVKPDDKNLVVLDISYVGTMSSKTTEIKRTAESKVVTDTTNNTKTTTYADATGTLSKEAISSYVQSVPLLVAYETALSDSWKFRAGVKAELMTGTSTVTTTSAYAAKTNDVANTTTSGVTVTNDPSANIDDGSTVVTASDDSAAVAFSPSAGFGYTITKNLSVDGQFTFANLIAYMKDPLNVIGDAMGGANAMGALNARVAINYTF